MTARALTPEERKAWAKLRRRGFEVYQCVLSGVWKWKFGDGFYSRQAAIRDAIRRNKV